MKPIERLLEILDEGAFITCEEMAELAREVRALMERVHANDICKRCVAKTEVCKHD